MMANFSSYGLYLLGTLLFLSGVKYSLCSLQVSFGSTSPEYIPRDVDPMETCKAHRLELAIRYMMRVLEDVARTAREVREIKEEVKSLEEEITSLGEGMKSSQQEIQSLKEELCRAVDTITSSVTNTMNNETVCLTESDPTPPEITGDSSCYDLLQQGHSYSGLYTVTISGKEVEVYCDMESDGGGWTVIQRRDDIEPHVDFNRGWEDYRRGFGDLNGEFWLGLDTIHALTSDPSTPMILRVDLEEWEGSKMVALYHTFVVKDERERYELSVGGYEKGPGRDPGDSLTYWHNNVAFSTYDQDNDGNEGSNCAENFEGGWWYRSCLVSNLNGVYRKGKYEQGVECWYHSREDYIDHYNLRRAAMKIRPR